MTDVNSALDLIMTAKYEGGTDRIAINKESFDERFFILNTGLTGEILQKMINYQVKIAIFGKTKAYNPLHSTPETGVQRCFFLSINIAV